MQFREKLKRSLPKPILGSLQALKRRMAAPPLEDTVLHNYEMWAESDTKPRLTLVIPSVAPEKTFGGILTGIDIFLELGKRTNADLRILLDEIGPVPAGNVIGSRAHTLGLDLQKIEILPRLVEIPRVAVRSSDIFLSYNWWTTLNIQQLVEQQSRHFGLPPMPTIYLIQEYEPFFQPFSLETDAEIRQESQDAWTQPSSVVGIEGQALGANGAGHARYIANSLCFRDPVAC